MAISVTWGTKVINVAKADMVLVQMAPSEIYEMDLDNFRLALGELLDDETGMVFPDTHNYFPPLSVGGANLARVIELINGYTVTYEDGQYRVQIVNGNSNLGEKINVNQVSVSTANSAGLQDLGSLQAASFDGEISIDVSSSFVGTTFPVGTRSNPVNNMADAHSIGEERGITTFHLVSDTTLTSEDFSDGHIFKSDNPSTATVTIESGANVSNCTFTNLTIQGVLDNANVLRECNILDITNNNGFIFQCALSGTITLGGAAQAMIMNCFSGIAGADLTPTLDMGGSGQSLAIRGYSGGIKIANRTGTDGVSIDVLSGQIIIDSTVTAGELTVRGHAKLTDNSTGTATIDKSGLLEGGYLTQNNFMALK